MLLLLQLLCLLPLPLKLLLSLLPLLLPLMFLLANAQLQRSRRRKELLLGHMGPSRRSGPLLLLIRPMLHVQMLCLNLSSIRRPCRVDLRPWRTELRTLLCVWLHLRLVRRRRRETRLQGDLRTRPHQQRLQARLVGVLRV